jgi:LmbE family N-acetylglucosaminyl deacetylase
MNILVIAAHPDDEVLGCGGAIARYSGEGHQVHVAILGEGVTSRYASRDRADGGLVDELHGHSRRVSELLGAKALHTFSLPDNRFDTVPLIDVVKIIEGLVEELQPQMVFTQHGGDLNVDHVVVFRATLTAVRPLANRSVKRLYAYEVASSTEWAFQQFSPVFQPSLFLDISQTLDLKIKAMEIYEGEIRAFPHPRSPEALHATALRWGSVAGLPAAEAFQCIYEIG